MKKLMKRVKKTMFFMGSIVVLASCGLASLFLVASGYESIYSRSLPFVHTVDPINLKAFEQSYNLDQSIVRDDKAYGTYGVPLTVKFPQRAARLDITQPLRDENGSWLSRANTLHLLVPEKPRNGSIGVALIYCRAGFRTITSSTLPAMGSNIFIDTDHNWRYVYKVTSTSVADSSRSYVMADGGGASKLLIGCYDEATKTNAYIEATLLSVQGIDS
jgi:hypothetical protein